MIAPTHLITAQTAYLAASLATGHSPALTEAMAAVACGLLRRRGPARERLGPARVPRLLGSKMTTDLRVPSSSVVLFVSDSSSLPSEGVTLAPKLGVDTAENGCSKIWVISNTTNPQPSLGSNKHLWHTAPARWGCSEPSEAPEPSRSAPVAPWDLPQIQFLNRI